MLLRQQQLLMQDNSNQSLNTSGFENQHPNTLQGDGELEEHPFKRPKLHLFKKDASRRINTSSATRNLQPIYPLESGGYNNFKLYSNNFNSINGSNTSMAS
jgi:hypothetical protein